MCPSISILLVSHPGRSIQEQKIKPCGLGRNAIARRTCMLSQLYRAARDLGNMEAAEKGQPPLENESCAEAHSGRPTLWAAAFTAYWA